MEDAAGIVLDSTEGRLRESLSAQKLTDAQRKQLLHLWRCACASLSATGQPVSRQFSTAFASLCRTRGVALPHEVQDHLCEACGALLVAGRSCTYRLRSRAGGRKRARGADGSRRRVKSELTARCTFCGHVATQATVGRRRTAATGEVAAPGAAAVKGEAAGAGGKKGSQRWLNSLGKKSAGPGTGSLLQQREASRKKAKKAKKGGLASLAGLL